MKRQTTEMHFASHESFSTTQLRVLNEPTYSDFLRHGTRRDRLFTEELSESADFPHLAYLRIELNRFRSGMSDFIIRVSSPKLDEMDRSNTIFTIRGTPELAKLEGNVKLAKKIAEEMDKRGDATHKWSEADVDHLAKLLIARVKLFAQDKGLELLQFSTEALV